ncbi:hypothetical protein IMZ48_19015 [Candidatus Bathyarchaeota archaeon]|nr:hypothetical protein [Candidatus Bathyarchaeota archaeon]
MAWQPPTVGSRPVAVLGAGVLGRRIACSFIAGGYNVNIYDLSPASLQDAADYVQAHADEFAAFRPSNSGNYGTCNVFDDLSASAKDAWLVVEAIPERIELKVDVFGKLDSICPPDCILGSNSSSYRSSLMVGKVSDERRRLVCNIHYTMPPQIRTVELMTAGQTHPEVFSFLEDVLRGCGMIPATAVKESTG